MISKDDPRFDAVLDANDPNFVNDLIDALGLKPGEKLQIMTPQFERTDGVAVALPAESLAEIGNKPRETLKSLGCCAWDEPDENGTVLMLFPYEWYDKIPSGMMLESISGEKEPFEHGKTDDDYRFGCLAYGVRVAA